MAELLMFIWFIFFIMFVGIIIKSIRKSIKNDSTTIEQIMIDRLNGKRKDYK